MFESSTATLDRQPPTTCAGDGPQNAPAASRLEEELQVFLAGHQDSVIGTSRVINSLLDLWDVAKDESQAAAGPVEHMLTVLVKRQCTSHDELARMADQVRQACRPDIDVPVSSGSVPSGSVPSGSAGSR